MATRVDHERPSIVVDAFERNPDAAHHLARKRRKVNHVLVQVLLASVNEIEGPAGCASLVVIDGRKDLEDLGVSPDVASNLTMFK